MTQEPAPAPRSVSRRTIVVAALVVLAVAVTTVVVLALRDDPDDGGADPTSTASPGPAPTTTDGGTGDAPDPADPGTDLADPGTVPDATGLSVTVVDQHAGTPDGFSGQDSGAVVMLDEGTIHVVTYGSSSCPLTPVSMEIVDGEIHVDVEGPAGDVMCTQDYAPTTTVIELPDEFADADVPPVVHVESALR
ncbi:hypothetical protein [Sanguibacter suaedae]|uniref:Uncharacterized protein n=1 Tax=Sanguibacter suaedae TaxID=2795737 RepID=A0A934I668_9MICO|nr:hypothetical protein [Sanguibacter suaedae]MBI9114976.1 hypothetical protein [Sanguibacter suaedae]